MIMGTRLNGRALLASAVVGATALFFACYLKGGPDSGKTEGKVSLRIAAPSAVRDGRYVTIICHATLDNRTDSAFVVKSNFFSAFDGLSVLVRTQAGEELGKTSFLMHQSPWTWEPQVFPLPPGKTSHRLDFTSEAIPPEIQTITIQVVGDLPGSTYDEELRSNSMVIKVKKEET
jgi:hypothetical protein